MLEAYLKEHGSITRLVYSECLGMARTTAAYELKLVRREEIGQRGKALSCGVCAAQAGRCSRSLVFYPLGIKEKEGGYTRKGGSTF